MEDIKNSKMVHDPLTLLQCSPTTTGAACAIIASEDFVIKYGLQDQAVEILASEMCTDLPETFGTKSSMNLVGYGLVKKAAK